MFWKTEKKETTTTTIPILLPSSAESKEGPSSIKIERPNWIRSAELIIWYRHWDSSDFEKKESEHETSKLAPPPFPERQDSIDLEFEFIEPGPTTTKTTALSKRGGPTKEKAEKEKAEKEKAVLLAKKAHEKDHFLRVLSLLARFGIREYAVVDVSGDSETQNALLSVVEKNHSIEWPLITCRSVMVGSVQQLEILLNTCLALSPNSSSSSTSTKDNSSSSSTKDNSSSSSTKDNSSSSSSPITTIPISSPISTSPNSNLISPSTSPSSLPISTLSPPSSTSISTEVATSPLVSPQETTNDELSKPVSPSTNECSSSTSCGELPAETNHHNEQHSFFSQTLSFSEKPIREKEEIVIYAPSSPQTQGVLQVAPSTSPESSPTWMSWFNESLNVFFGAPSVSPSNSTFSFSSSSLSSSSSSSSSSHFSSSSSSSSSPTPGLFQKTSLSQSKISEYQISELDRCWYGNRTRKLQLQEGYLWRYRDDETTIRERRPLGDIERGVLSPSSLELRFKDQGTCEVVGNLMAFIEQLVLETRGNVWIAPSADFPLATLSQQLARCQLLMRTILEEEWCLKENIFRSNGSKQQINTLEALIRAGSGLPQELARHFDPLAVSGALKALFIQPFEQCLITEDTARKFIALGADPEQLEKAFFRILTPLQREYLEKIIEFIHQLSLMEERTKLAKDGLPILFAPCTLPPPKSISPTDLPEYYKNAIRLVEHLLAKK